MASELGVFEGKRVVASKVIVKRAGDGLAKPLAADPRAWESGMRAPILLWGTFGKIEHDPVKEGEGFVRIHDFDTEEAIVLDQVDIGMLEELMSEQRRAVFSWESEQARLKAEAKGVVQLPGTEVTDSDWEASAKAQRPSSIGEKRAKKAHPAKG